MTKAKNERPRAETKLTPEQMQDAETRKSRYPSHWKARRATG